jgi:alpha-glucosidase (family GH31 glycosyl hydrolase)
MDWHMKNGWTGWTFDKQLFPYPEDTLGYLKSRGLLLAANLHDALGVGNWDRQYEPRKHTHATPPSFVWLLALWV